MTAGQLKITKFYLSDWYSIKKKKKNALKNGSVEIWLDWHKGNQ